MKEENSKQIETNELAESNKTKRMLGPLAWGTVSVLCLLLLTFLATSFFLNMAVKDISGRVFWLDPTTESTGQDLGNAPVFQAMVRDDLSNLMAYLAAARQMVTEGEFDASKKIDVIAYVNRKGRVTREELADLKLEYEVGDLLQWEREGALYETLNAPYDDHVPGVPASEETNGEEDPDPYDEDGVLYDGDGETLSDYGVNEDTVPVVDAQGALGEEQTQETESAAGDQQISIEVERYLPVDGTGIYELAFYGGAAPENVSIQPAGLYELARYGDMALAKELFKIVHQAGSDLMINYSAFNVHRQQYSKEGDRSIKYALCDRAGNIIYSNMELDGRRLDAKAVKALEQAHTFFRYDYSQKELVRSGIGSDVFSEIDTKMLFDKYDYLFEDTCVYFAVDTKAYEDENGLYPYGAVTSANVYPTLYTKYFSLYSGRKQTAGIFFALVAAYIFAVLLFMYKQPKKEKESLGYLDRGFTELAAACYILFCGGLSVLILYADYYLLEELLWDQFPNAGWQQLFQLLAVVSAFVIQLLFLFAVGSLERRIKAGTFFKGSLLRLLLVGIVRILRKLAMGLKRRILRLARGIRRVNEKPSRFFHSILPFTVFVLVNLLAVLFLREIGCLLALVFDCVVGYRLMMDKEEITEGIIKISEGNLNYQIDTYLLAGENRMLAEAVNKIGTAVKEAVEQSRKDERLKAELITNVSHDIKTPLTSIVNYVDLLKKEEISNEKAKEYIAVLDKKSQRLKQLTLDLVEASKVSTGNIQIEYTNLNLLELMKQAIGEYEDKFQKRKLQIIFSEPKQEQPVVIRADSRHTWRIMDNLLGNISKYAMESSRVYIDVDCPEKKAVVTLKNISANALNISPDELLQRFTRGDESRSTEGSGLGLSIAQSLVTLQGGQMELTLDGDLFKVIIQFDLL